MEVTSDAALYEVPSPIPDVAHGTLLKYQVVTPTSAAGATTYRVMYTSRSVQEMPNVVTGIVLVPTAAPPAAGRLMLTIAHGTTGVADECAPSKTAVGLEINGMALAVADGWLVAITDYEGMGTPGRHPYLVGPSEGRSVIDAALAARSLPGASVGAKLAIGGYSQGGHGALWAGEVAPTWAPDVEVVGTFAGAPATENFAFLNVVAGVPNPGFAYMMVAGFQAAYPNADPAKVLTELGLTKLDAVDQACNSELFKAVAGPPGELFLAGGTESPPWSTLIAENHPGNVKVDSPVLIIHSDGDATVPIGLSEILHARMCSKGQVVERRVLEGGGSHGAAAVPAYLAGFSWLKARAVGTPAVNDCSSS